MRLLVLTALAAVLTACSEQPPTPSIYDGAVVVKICMDGSHIYRLKDGRYIEGGLGAREVENPATVCAAK
jgi:hypothetical protein